MPPGIAVVDVPRGDGHGEAVSVAHRTWLYWPSPVLR
jgi:hypothetical protein